MNILLKSLTIGLLLSTSLGAYAQKRIASNDRTKPQTSEPKFIENVVIENKGGFTTTTTTITRKYNVDNTTARIVPEEETAESKQTAKQNINKGKQEGNTSLYNFIEEWYGTRYVYGGTDRKGIDCSALVRTLVAEVYGARLKRTAAEQFEETEYISNQKNLKEGDLVFFKIRSRNISHVGVYLEDGLFVHASRSKGVVISDLSDAYWSRYYVGGGKLKN